MLIIVSFDELKSRKDVAAQASNLAKELVGKVYGNVILSNAACEIKLSPRDSREAAIALKIIAKYSKL